MTNLYDPNGSLYRERLRRALSDGRSEPPEAEKPAAEKSTMKCEVCGWHTNGVPYSEHVAALSQMDAAKQENNAWKVSVAEYVQQLESSLASAKQEIGELKKVLEHSGISFPGGAQAYIDRVKNAEGLAHEWKARYECIAILHSQKCSAIENGDLVWRDRLADTLQDRQLQKAESSLSSLRQAVIALALPVVIFGGLILGIAELMTYAISGKWMD
jgi:hypothetical protein